MAWTTLVRLTQNDCDVNACLNSILADSHDSKIIIFLLQIMYYRVDDKERYRRPYHPVHLFEIQVVRTTSTNTRDLIILYFPKNRYCFCVVVVIYRDCNVAVSVVAKRHCYELPSCSQLSRCNTIHSRTQLRVCRATSHSQMAMLAMSYSYSDHYPLFIKLLVKLLPHHHHHISCALSRTLLSMLSDAEKSRR